MKRIDHHQKWNPVLAGVVPAHQQLPHFGRVHRRVPRHVGHEQEQRVDGVRVLVRGVGDHHVHQAVRRKRRLPRVRLVDAQRPAVLVDHQILGARGVAVRHAFERRVWREDHCRIVFRKRAQRNAARIRRFSAEIARSVERTQQHLDQMQRAAGMKSVGVGGNPAHRVHRHRPPDHLVVRASVHVGPADRELHGLVERDMRHLARDAHDRLRGHAAFRRHGLRRIAAVQVALCGEREHRLGDAAVVELDRREQGWRDLGLQPVDEALRLLVPDQGIIVGAAREQPVAGMTRRLHHQPGCVGVADQEFPVDQAALEQDVRDGERQQAVRAGPDRKPFVGDRRVSGANGIDRNELRAATLERFEPDLDRIRGVVFGHAPKDEILGVIPIGRAKLPERITDRIQPRDRHVHRAEAAMRCPVRRAELLRPQAG